MLRPATRWPWLTAALLWLGAATAARGQDVRGAVLDSATKQPVSGAVVMLLDSAGAVLRRTMSDDQGRYRMLLPPGAHNIQARRIGFRPRTVSSLSPETDILLTSIPSMLEPVRVVAEFGGRPTPGITGDDRRCSAREDRAAAFGLWDQARSGLLATVVAREVIPASLTRLRFERAFDVDNRIRAQRVTIDSSGTSALPFIAARSAADFVRTGFAEEGVGGITFFAPDDEIMLDVAFAQAYCFQLADADRARPRQVGLRFEPAARRRGRVDIDGTLWIDTAARVLRDLEFRYLGLDRTIEAFRPGGRLSFHEMVTGISVIDRWSLRLVAVEPDTTNRVTATNTIRRGLFTIREIGGELARVRWGDGSIWAGSLGLLRVQVVTPQGAPAPGTVLRLRGTDYKATADSRGFLEIRDLLPGPYAAAIEDPKLATIGVAFDTPLSFVAGRDSVLQVQVEMSTTEEYLAGVCRADGTPMAGTAWLLGRVTTRSGSPVSSAYWTIRRTDRPESASGAARRLTGLDGVFRACDGLGLGTTVEIRVWTEDAPPVVVVRQLTEKVTVLPIELSPRPEATNSGSDPESRPVLPRLREE